MPIYAYRCSNCGHEQDVLQKMSDAPLTQCPACEQSTYVKQVTAAGFQLKGSGWYVTDFKNNGAKPAPTGTKSADDKSSDASAGDAKSADSKPTDSKPTDGGPTDSKSSDKPAVTAPSTSDKSTTTSASSKAAATPAAPST